MVKRLFSQTLVLAKSKAQTIMWPELQHVSRIEIHKSETGADGVRTPYQKRAPPMVKVGNIRDHQKTKSLPPDVDGQCKNLIFLTYLKSRLEKTETLGYSERNYTSTWMFLSRRRQTMTI